MSPTVLLTGGTGFIGTEVALELLRRPDTNVIALVRASGANEAERRARRAWWDQPALSAEIGKKVTVLAGDVSKGRLGLSDGEYRTVVKTTTHVIHAAAEVRLDVPAERLRAVNVQGTANVLELARRIHEDHGLGRLVHLSTAYVAGKRTGDVAENELTDGAGFSSEYERSKFDAEKLVREAGRELPVTVLRPGMVVGDSRTGYVRNFNTLYVPVRLYLTGRSRIIPVSPSMRVNFVPVDYVAGAAGLLAFDPRSEGRTFHLTAPPEKLPTVRELVAHVREWAARNAGLKLPKPVFLPLRSLADRRGEALGLLSPYFNENRRFLRNGADELLGPYAPDWKDYLGRLLAFAVYNGFLHRSGRTVHEQILFRLESRSRPVRCFDIIDGKNVERPAAGLRREMLEATNALRAMGVRPGDRVAIVGQNSTRYLSLDVAIGLAGAVSVPLYYTSPPAELDGIIKASGARLLLVGAPKVLERLGELTTGVAIVSFWREELPAGVPERVMGWEAFLVLGKGAEGAGVAKGSRAKGAGAGRVDGVAEAPVAPDDLATLRFTSGTTGFPKGVEFTHRGVRWMGEAVASLFPYGVRSREISYLSFLPMNHVVEGILSTYAMFYAPAPLSVHFLEDFRGLAKALPTVRPTVFFSVPRVYEKLWAGLCESGAGKRYLRSGKAMKGLLRGAIRRGLLQRAGLDRCGQLLVGSAPACGDLLSNLRELGIEVHDAYGMTEAPLVTLNRLGRNRIGTVGQPLPETEIRTAADGEILVRGPQVTRGYFGEKDQPFSDGWLRTGDLGRLDGGYLVIEGRKKELLATSYGKKIQPLKIETMLKGIAGVAEAMVVGENRPCCTAVLWLAEGTDPNSVDGGVERVNARLSHPEQLRRWAALKNDLSIESGELTANLKLRRREALLKREDVVKALYNEGPAPSSVLHIGAAGGEA
jgi:long-chain acyl-CoA synthetase